MKNRTATCLLICTTALVGCSSTPRLTSWAAKPSVIPEKEVERAHSSESSSKSLAQVGTQNVEENLQAAQSELDQWSRDQNPRRLQTARIHFEAVLKQRPMDAKAHHGLAILADLEKNYAVAERHYQQALTQNPGDSTVLANLGYSYLLQNRLAESERYSLMSVQANPGNQNALRNLGHAYARQGKTELAEATYARVMSPDEVKRSLAENSASSPVDLAQSAGANAAPAASPSIMDRILPSRNPGEKLLAEIQSKQQKHREEQQRTQNTSTLRRPNAGFPGERLAPEESLRQRLAQIDQQSAPSVRPESGPILLDDQTRQMTRLTGADAANWSQGANQPMSASMLPMREAPGYADRSNDGDSVSPQSSSYQSLAGGHPAGGAPAGHPSQYQYEDQDNSGLAGRPRSQVTGGQPGLQPWSGVPVPPNRQESTQVSQAYQQYAAEGGPDSTVLPAAGQYVGQYSSQYSGQNQNPAPYQQMPGQQAPLSQGPQGAGVPSMQNAFGQAAQRSTPQNNQQGTNSANGSGVPQGFANGNPGGRPQPPMGNAPFGINPQGQMDPRAAGPTDPYQEASRAAARMGMGLPASPMSMHTPVNPPGSMSYDSMNVPPPYREMPDQRSIQNLNQSYQPVQSQNPPLMRSQGVASPDVIAPMYNRQQYNSPERFDEQTMMNSNIPKNNWDAMKNVEAQRWAAGQQGNRPVQDIWNTGPINNAVSPASGSQYFHPSMTGPTYSPNPAPVTPNGVRPDPWPAVQQAVPTQAVIQAEATHALPTNFQQYMDQRDREVAELRMQNMRPNAPQAGFINPDQSRNAAGQQGAVMGPQHQQQTQPQQPQEQQFADGIKIPPSYRVIESNPQGNGRNPAPSANPGAPVMQQSGTSAASPDSGAWPVIRPR